MKTAPNIEANKALVLRFFTAIENGDFRVFDEIVAEDYDDHLAGQTPGRETLKRYFTGLRSAFADLKLPITAMVAEGNLVAVLNRSAARTKVISPGSKRRATPSTQWRFSSIALPTGNWPSTGKSPTSRL